MCILFIAINQHPNYPLIIAANRDEFHARETQSMHWWPSQNILAGKDLQGLGTWLCFSSSGRLSALTNYRQLPLKKGNFQSRGELPLLAMNLNDSELNTYLQANHTKFQGFNLLFGHKNALTCYDSIRQEFTPLKPGFHSICNGSLDDIWPKMAKGKQALEHYIKCSGTVDHDALLALLQDTQQAPEDLLPDTGIGLTWEKRLSAIMILGKEYGTRSSCVYTQSVTGEINVTEVSYSANNSITDQQHYNWPLK